MNIIFLLLPLSLVLAATFIYGFIFAVRDGQYDDLESPAHRALIDDAFKSKDKEKHP